MNHSTRARIPTPALKPLCAILLTAGLVSPAAALDYFWLGGNGDWDDATKWSLLDVPGAGDHAWFDQAGTATLTAARTVGALTMSTGTITGASLTVNGSATMSGGTHGGSGTTHFSGSVLFSGNGSRSFTGNRVVNMAGTTTWAGNTAHGGNAVTLRDGATINNHGTWNDANAFDSALENTGGSRTPTSNNLRSYNKLGAGSTVTEVVFSNAGQVNIAAGRFAMLTGTAHSGMFHVAEGATLSFGDNGVGSGLTVIDAGQISGNGHVMLAAADGGSGNDLRIGGTGGHGGRFTLQSGLLEIAGHYTLDNYEQTGGQLVGAGTLVINNAQSLNATDQRGSGTTLFNNDVSITTGSRLFAGTRTAHFNATTTWAGNTAHGGNAVTLRDGATINNHGTWSDANAFDSALENTGGSGTPTFNNLGTYNKLGASTTTVEVAFHNAGTLNVHQGAVFSVTNTGFTNTGTIAGTGTIVPAANGRLTSSGLVSPGFDTGTLTVDGDLLIQPAGQLDIELASLADFDLLAVTGDITLAGALHVVNLGYTPVVGDSFVIVSFDQRLDDSVFAGLSWSGFGTGVQFDVIYNANDVTLNVTAVPEPSTWALWLAGVAALGGLSRRRRPAAGGIPG